MTKAKLGYGNPPKQHRFKKGQSGNPKGRPRKTNNSTSILKEIAGEKLPLMVGNKKTNMQSLKALLSKLRNSALQGDMGAAKLFLSLCEKYGVFDDDKTDGIGMSWTLKIVQPPASILEKLEAISNKGGIKVAMIYLKRHAPELLKDPDSVIDDYKAISPKKDPKVEKPSLPLRSINNKPPGANGWRP